jgi:hypothetical protein
MRAWASRLLVVVAAFASMATSQKKWELTASVPDGMPTWTSSQGNDGLRITVEASGLPHIVCTFADSPSMSRLVPPEPSSPNVYICPPGSKLEPVTLGGRFGGGCRQDTDHPPKNAHLRIVKTELVPMWRATVEETFEVASDKYVSFVVESPHTSFVDASIEGADTTKHVRVGSWPSNEHNLIIDGGDGSAKVVATVHVKATVFGVCEARDCTKPDGEQLKIVRTE